MNIEDLTSWKDEMFIENGKNKNAFSSIGAACKKPAIPTALKIDFKNTGVYGNGFPHKLKTR